MLTFYQLIWVELMSIRWKDVQSFLGEVVIASTNGGLYNNSIVARNILLASRVAIIRGGCEVEV